jgi:gluconokinase
VTRVLAVDVGSSSVRARVFDESAGEIAGARGKRSYETAHGDDGRAEFDPDELVELTIGVIDEACGRADTAVDAVGMSCFWHGLMAVDARGRAASPVVTWRDRRPLAAAQELRRRLDPAAVHAATGCPLHPSFWPAKLLWLRGESPELFRGGYRFVSFCDYLLARLHGELRTSLSMASATGLLSVDERCWSEELLAALGLAPDVLPPISDEPVGGREPWFPALGDGACDNVGAGCVTADRACLMVGTSAALRVVRPDDGARPRHGLFLYRVDDRRVVEGGSLSDGGNLHAWLGRTLRLPEGWTVGDRQPDAHGLTFLPLLGGERAPGWNGGARGAVAGLTFETEPLELAQAALEGVALRFADLLDLLPDAREIVSTGHALAVNTGWLQVVADALGRSVRISPVDETSTRGAAVTALERLGETPPQPPLGELVEPRPGHSVVYRAARERQRALYRELIQRQGERLRSPLHDHGLGP